MDLLQPQHRIYVAGHSGLVGSAIWRALAAAGYDNLIGRRSGELDLRDHDAVDAFIQRHQPDAVVLAAAKVGGIAANSEHPVEFISDNLRIQTAVLDAALKHRIPRVLFLGSSCIYPKLAAQPINEDALLTGPLEPTNRAYALAKIAGIVQVQSVRSEYGLPWISAMPTNLYGPGDNFDPEHSHVLPGLLRRFDEAARSGATEVVVWGTGSPRREFLHVDDLAEACVHLLRHYNDDTAINVGTGVDVTIKELAKNIAAVTGFTGSIVWDTSRPDGTPRKLLDVSRIKETGWSARISLDEGLASTYQWYESHRENLRG
ncbi:MAG TPA: GDP-fucose synthetase [Actinobacteria bacterium]|nr:GDP-fucose synthetase [Actinomycetota bacterium]